MTPLQGECIHSVPSRFGTVRIFENPTLRWLQFDNQAVQSMMSLRYPQRLALPYMQQMMMALLLRAQAPANALVLGLGGGAFVRFLRAVYPGIYIDAVERDAEVIALAAQYFGVSDGVDGIRISRDDVEHFVQTASSKYDLVLLDIIEGTGTSACLRNREFLSACKALCTAQGVLAINLVADSEQVFLDVYGTLRTLFAGQVLCMTDANHRNLVLLARCAADEAIDRDYLLRRAALLQSAHINTGPYIDELFRTNPHHAGVLLAADQVRRE